MRAVTRRGDTRTLSAGADAGSMGGTDVANIVCPWCEVELELDVDELSAEQTCSSCLTSWSYAEVERDELAPAA